jgi:hypothetical protein
LVVTPAEVSHLDTGRALSTLREVRTPVLGGVENMAYFKCPSCGEKTELHAPAPDERTIWASGVERLARLPFRPDAVIDAADLAPVLEAVAAHIAAYGSGPPSGYAPSNNEVPTIPIPGVPVARIRAALASPWGDGRVGEGQRSGA